MTATSKYKTREATLADAANEAYSEFASLGEEMREWADNLEEKFSATDRYARISEAADALEGLSEPDYPDWASKTKVQVSELVKPLRRRISRATRRDNACAILDTCMEACNEWLDENDKPENRSDEMLGIIGEITQIRDDLENLKDEAEAVEFPGMYG
jgi:capsid portal protein